MHGKDRHFFRRGQKNMPPFYEQTGAQFTKTNDNKLVLFWQQAAHPGNKNVFCCCNKLGEKIKAWQGGFSKGGGGEPVAVYGIRRAARDTPSRFFSHKYSK
ncbi:MAG: hypothetical protein LBU42_02955 [Prevotellaceae bacterium]|jgi:hypothetical protein|nr:hypothetical protein [Prevotellaceae bacterium]